MARWRIDLIDEVRTTLGSVEAPDRERAIAKAAEMFNIPPARQKKIVVTRLYVKETD